MAEDFTQRATCECYYKFENSGDLGEDEQGQIDLTNTNGVTQSPDMPSGTYANPSATKSADFEDSSSQYLTASHADSIEIDDLSAFTFIAWAKCESLVSIDFIYSKGYTGHCFGINTAYVRPYFGGVTIQPSATINTGTWYFFAATYSQVSDTLRAFRGAEETQVSELGSGEQVDKTAATVQEFNIGCYEDQSLLFDGLITEFAIFSEELSLAELQEIQADGMEGAPAGNPYYAYAQQ